MQADVGYRASKLVQALGFTTLARPYVIAVVLLLAAGLLLVQVSVHPNTGPCGSDAGSFAIAPDGTKLWLELAQTTSQIERGLMFRNNLPPDHGMLFVFNDRTQSAFWMRDTRVPLSIAWLDREANVNEIQDMKPMSDQLHRPLAPYWYAVEVNQGWFASHGVHPQDHLTLCTASTGR